jgi:magnesium and cobalt transporter
MVARQRYCYNKYMNEDPEPQHRSWLDRLTRALHRHPRSRKELIEVIRNARNRHLLNSDALAMIEGVLNVSEEQARDVMVPRSQMVIIQHDSTPQEALPIIIESTHSRFPVIAESRDEVLGILLAKDLLQYLGKTGKISVQIKDLTRPAIFIPESKRLDVLLREFRATRNHMAMVVDEYGGVAGLITIEDVLEEIVGEIEDETDIASEEPNIKQISDTEYTVKALTPIEEFNAYFNLTINNEDFDTFGGYMMQRYGHLPVRGETITFNSFQATILLASKRRLQLIQLEKISENENE